MYLSISLSIDSLLFMFKKRDRATIIADIIKSIRSNSKGRRKTNIMQSANLSSDQMNKYLDLLIRNGYIIMDEHMYKPTSRGLRLLENLETDYLKLKVRI